MSRTVQEERQAFPSTRNTSLYLMSIRKLFNEAVKQYNKPDQGLIHIKNTPFTYFHIPKQEATQKRAIAPEQIRKMVQLPYQAIYKGIHHTNRFNLAKDSFLLSFCMMGITLLTFSTQRNMMAKRLLTIVPRRKAEGWIRQRWWSKFPRCYNPCSRNTRIGQVNGYSTELCQ